LAVERGVVNVATAPDGAIYVIGGDTFDGPTDLVERYDVEADAWRIVGKLAIPRWQHSSVFISPTEILIVAGWQESSAEIFNVTTGESKRIADFPSVANSLVPIELPGLPPAFIGGRTAGPITTITSVAKSYDRANDLWVDVCEFADRLVRPTTLPLRDGRVLVVGGVKTENPFVTSQTIDVVKAQYDVGRVGELLAGRQWHGAGQWSNGQVLVAGGFVDGPGITASTEWIDIANNTSKPGPEMAVPRTYVDMVTFRDGGGEYAVVAGGLSSLTTGTATVEYIGGPCAQGIQPIKTRELVSVGSALPRDSTIELTQAAEFSRGAVWSATKIDLRQPMSMLVGFRMTNGNDNGEREPLPSGPGADGIALVIQNEGPQAIGQYGRGVGYDGIKRSLAIEFDTYQNEPMQDPNGSHIGIQSMSREPNTARHSPPANLGFTSTALPLKADGRTYYAYIQYQNRQLRIFFNDRPSFRRPVLTRDIDIDSLIGLDPDGGAWVGITSATGQSVEQHEIIRWEINGCDGDAFVSVVDELQGPEQDQVTVRLHNNRLIRTSFDLATISIYDCQGRLISSDVTYSSEFDLDARGLNNGCYIIRVVYGERVLSLPWLLAK